MRNKGKQREKLYRQRRAVKKGELRQKTNHRASHFYLQAEMDEDEIITAGYAHKVLKHLKQNRFEMNIF